MKPGVMMLVNEFAPLPVGGAERQAERLAAHLAQRGWPVRVLTRHAPSLPLNEQRSGFTIERLRPLGPGKLKTLTFVLAAIGRLWRLRRNYQIIHAHLAFGPAFAAAVIGRLLGKRVLIKFGNSGKFGDIQVSQATWRGRLRLATFRRWVDTLIVLDEAMEQEVLAAGFPRQRVRRMPNGIDAQAFAPGQSRPAARAALGLPEQTTVLYMGRMSAQKSLPMLLQAFQSAVQRQPLHLVLLGEGPDREALEAQAAALGVAGQVSFPGSQADVHPYLHAADIFVLPSVVEGISNALLEAMSCGLACIATPVGGTPEALEGGRCGILLPAGQIESSALAEALVELAQDPARRRQLGELARQRILSTYDFAVVGAQYEALYSA